MRRRATKDTDPKFETRDIGLLLGKHALVDIIDDLAASTNRTAPTSGYAQMFFIPVRVISSAAALAP